MAGAEPSGDKSRERQEAATTTAVARPWNVARAFEKLTDPLPQGLSSLWPVDPAEALPRVPIGNPADEINQ
jgi:hypothetical protein